MDELYEAKVSDRGYKDSQGSLSIIYFCHVFVEIAQNFSQEKDLGVGKFTRNKGTKNENFQLKTVPGKTYLKSQNVKIFSKTKKF